MGLCESLYVPAAIGMITQAHPGPTRSRALSIHGFAQYLGITAGGWYGGWAADHIGWRCGFFVLAAVGLIYSGFLFRVFPARSLPRSFKQRQLHSASFFRSYCFIALAALFFSFCAVLWILYAWLPSFIYERYHLTLTASGLIATLYLQSGSATGVLLGGVLGDFLAKRHAAARLQIVAWALLASAPFALAALATHSLLGMKVTALGFGLFAGFLMANIFSALYDVVERSSYGLATGTLNAIGGAGAGAAILLAGVWKQSVGIERIMLYGLALCVASSVALLLVIETRFASGNQSVVQVA